MSDENLACAWLRAAADPGISGALEYVYGEVAAEIAARKPVCVASGRCCNFREAGHLLYVTGLEAAYAVAQLGRAVTPAEVEEATARGDCPFLEGTLCGVHTIKPLGCRVYYCDPTAQEWQQALTENALRAIRELHDEHGVPYRYGEWRGMLRLFANGSGRRGPG